VTRLRALAGILPTYASIAWSGLVWPRVRRGVDAIQQAVVLSERGVLLALRGDLRGFELPGGSALAGESDEEAVRREVREETGVLVEVEARVGDYVRSGFRPHRARVWRCRAVGGAPRPGDETLAVAWFDPAAPPAALFPWYRAPLADALGRWPSPVLRHERLGAAAVLAGLRIDLRMRLSSEPASAGAQLAGGERS